MTWATITGAGVTTATKFFGDVMNKINDMFAGSDISDTVTINSAVIWTFQSSALRATDLRDTNGNEVIVLGVTASAINEVTITNAIIATNPKIAASGGDTNIDLQLAGKGTGVAKGVRETIMIAASDETTALTTGTAKVTFRMPYAFTITDIKATVTTAPTDATLIIDVHETGTTIMTTDKLDIETGEFSTDTATTQPTVTDTSLADDAEITIDIDQVGSTIAGAGAKVYILGYQA